MINLFNPGRIPVTVNCSISLLLFSRQDLSLFLFKLIPKILAVDSLKNPGLTFIDCQLFSFCQMLSHILKLFKCLFLLCTVHINIITKPAKMISLFFHIFVKIIQVNITQQRTQRATLENPFRLLTANMIIHHRTTKICLNQSQHSRILNLSANPLHQNIMVDIVKEIFNIQLRTPDISCFHICDCLLNGFLRSFIILVCIRMS